MSISAVIIAKNAEKILPKSLSSVQFADEIILVDIQSTDSTKAIAKKYASKVYDFAKDSKFVEPVRNFALSKTSKDWILVLDADEEIPPSLAKKLQEIDQKNLGDIFYLARKNMVSKYWMQHTGWWPDYQLRFFKKGLVSWSDKIHGQAQCLDGYKANILEAKEDLAILHHNYQDTKDYLSRFDRYTDIEASQKQKALEKQFTISQNQLLQVFSDDWLRRFFAKEGYKDGVRGFYLSLMQAAYQMTVQMKIFDLLGSKQELEINNPNELKHGLRRFQKELNYWISDFEIKQAKGLSRWWMILKRKLTL
jgi:glycosyltransferase involved in cell wall biosynthesis